MFKLTATSLLAVLAVTVAAQSIPKYQSFPAACQEQCASPIQSSVLCYGQYQTGQEIVSCFCNGASSSADVSSCSTCLASNGASELANVLSAIPDACATYTKTCQKECGFDTCASSDITCQCGESYLASIYQCAACNTKNGNTGATGLTDYEALAGSCGAQNYTASLNSAASLVTMLTYIPDQVPATTSSALPSPTGQPSYSAPSLAVSASSYSMGASSVTGFAISADGATTTVAVSSSQSVIASSVSSASSGAVSAASSSAKASSSSAASASSARASSASASGSAIPAATSPASGALSLGVNAVGIVGAIFGVVALF